MLRWPVRSVYYLLPVPLPSQTASDSFGFPSAECWVWLIKEYSQFVYFSVVIRSLLVSCSVAIIAQYVINPFRLSIGYRPKYCLLIGADWHVFKSESYFHNHVINLNENSPCSQCKLRGGGGVNYLWDMDVLYIIL